MDMTHLYLKMIMKMIMKMKNNMIFNLIFNLIFNVIFNFICIMKFISVFTMFMFMFMFMLIFFMLMFMFINVIFCMNYFDNLFDYLNLFVLTLLFKSSYSPSFVLSNNLNYDNINIIISSPLDEQIPSLCVLLGALIKINFLEILMVLTLIFIVFGYYLEKNNIRFSIIRLILNFKIVKDYLPKYLYNFYKNYCDSLNNYKFNPNDNFYKYIFIYVCLLLLTVKLMNLFVILHIYSYLDVKINEYNEFNELFYNLKSNSIFLILSIKNNNSLIERLNRDIIPPCTRFSTSSLVNKSKKTNDNIKPFNEDDKDNDIEIENEIKFKIITI